MMQRNDTGQVMMVLVGTPGAGKSTIAKNVCEQCSNWRRISQDRLGSRSACVASASAQLRLGKSVVIDRCNFNREQRAHWLQLAQEQRVNCFAVVVDTAFDVCVQRALSRKNHEGATTLRSGGAAKGNAPPNHPQDPRSRPPSCTSIDSSS